MMSVDPNFTAQQQGYANMQAARRVNTAKSTNNRWLWLIIPLAAVLLAGGLWAMGVFRVGLSSAVIDGTLYRQTEDVNRESSGAQRIGRVEDVGRDGELEGDFVINWGYGDATVYATPKRSRFAYVKPDGENLFYVFKIPILRYWFG